MSNMANGELTLTRVIDAPRTMVFDAITQPQHMVRWFGPRGYTNSDCTIDLRPGGSWSIIMESPEFPGHRVTGVYKEITAPEKLVFTSRGFIDEHDNAGIESINSILLEELDGKTKLTLHVQLTKLAAGMEAAADGMEEGWSQTLEKLMAIFAK